MSLLNLRLQFVPHVLGIYGKSKSLFPDSAAWLHPEAAVAFADLEKRLGTKVRCSDVFRSAEQSLAARAEKAGVQPPGFSLHNYGIAIDIDVDSMLKTLKVKKPELDALFAEAGWFCHRKDGRREAEEWHFNHLGPDAPKYLAAAARSTVTSAAGDARIVALYGDALTLTEAEAQEALKKLRLYNGDIDGVFGPRSREALRAFQRTWKLDPSGEINYKTERTLAYVTADRTEIR